MSIQLKITQPNQLQEEEVQVVFELVNEVYKIFEADLWGEDYLRVETDKIKELVSQNRLVIGRVDGRIVSVLDYEIINPAIARFGMLAVHPQYRQHKIATQLVDHIEQLSKAKNIKEIQLELLDPVKYAHADKEILKAWYYRRGYRFIRVKNFEDYYPHLATIIKQPCNFKLFVKNVV